MGGRGTLRPHPCPLPLGEGVFYVAIPHWERVVFLWSVSPLPVGGVGMGMLRNDRRSPQSRTLTSPPSPRSSPPPGEERGSREGRAPGGFRSPAPLPPSPRWGEELGAGWGEGVSPSHITSWPPSQPPPNGGRSYLFRPPPLGGGVVNFFGLPRWGEELGEGVGVCPCLPVCRVYG